MKFIALPVRNLCRRRVRSALTVVGIAVAVGGLLALVGLSRGLERGWLISLRDRGTHLLALKKGSIEVLTAALDERLADQIRQMPGVDAVMGGLGDLVELESGEMAYLSGWPLDSYFWRDLAVLEGHKPSAREPEAVVFGEALAKLLGKRPGDSIQLSGRSFTISGISRQASVVDDRSVMIPLAAMQRLMGREGKVSGFHVRVKRPENPAELERTQMALAAAFPDLSFIPSGEAAQNNHVTRLLRAIAWSASSVALAMAFLAVLNTLLMAVTERMREISLLSAVGWSASRTTNMIVLEGMILAATGAALGIGVGLLCLRWITAHPKLGGLIQPDVTAGIACEAFALALLLGLVGSLYPAWRATRLTPMDLLRGE